MFYAIETTLKRRPYNFDGNRSFMVLKLSKKIALQNMEIS